jgi:hypothetical protein
MAPNVKWAHFGSDPAWGFLPQGLFAVLAAEPGAAPDRSGARFMGFVASVAATADERGQSPAVVYLTGVAPAACWRVRYEYRRAERLRRRA